MDELCGIASASPLARHRQSRLRAATGCVVALVLLVSSVSMGEAAGAPSRARTQKLWRSFPLNPTERSRTGTDTTAPMTGRQDSRARAARTESTGSGGGWLVLVEVAGAALIAGIIAVALAAITRHRRRATPVAGVGAPPLRGPSRRWKG